MSSLLVSSRSAGWSTPAPSSPPLSRRPLLSAPASLPALPPYDPKLISASSESQFQPKKSAGGQVRSVYTAMKAPISAKCAEADRSIHRYSIFGLDWETLELQQLTIHPGSGAPLRRELGGLPPPRKACSFGGDPVRTTACASVRKNARLLQLSNRLASCAPGWLP